MLFLMSVVNKSECIKIWRRGKNTKPFFLVQGICAHVDLLQFEDGIAILSLESSCVMHFARLPEGSSRCQYDYQARDPKEFPSTGEEKIPVLLEPGDLILLSGEARYDWTHEINRSEDSQVWGGETITQSRRTSVTLRKLIPRADDG
jgi:alkylated DNA repair dioxygenase AlkB